ncbi:MAG: 1-deoxy-D-xylulose-5-phosphate reductoisomerase [Deltaproteobacteria bacterium]|jgi:1-deoxy-D-xylulose-5-phosphate reductoisomerase|nr:1-deoxy-D-xylulose-5-phosphate reductoisomerase [Deltaproteobacteria bacterium]
MLSYISPLPCVDYALRWPRRLVILGSTGSIGRSALDVVTAQEDLFCILALAGGKNIRLLAEQAEKWRPRFLAVQDNAGRKALLALLSYKAEVLTGPEGYVALASLEEADLVLSAQVGAAGLKGTLAAVRAGKVVALANKESLVLAGEIVREECLKNQACILPVDSEHNAIFQCLAGLSGTFGESLRPAQEEQSVKRIILTASGGPFRGKSHEFLAKAKKEDALAHPTWSMGAKITIDSASMMNKGFEIIEACHLYGLSTAQVEVLVHPQSIIHSLIEYQDNSQIAQLGCPDMRIPISVCLGWPRRIQSNCRQLSLLQVPALSFEAPDEKLFPALNLCKEAFLGGRGLTVALNAANEVAVELFMQDKLSFTGISTLVGKVLNAWSENTAPRTEEHVLALDTKARRMALEVI